ncbi:MAG: MFS transporter [Candidatus Dormibacteraceae bacterium]
MNSGQWPAFRVGAYRWYWVGGLVSDIGNWVQNTTVPYVVLMLTHQAVWVGIATAVSLLSQVIGTLPGGRLADRSDRLTLLLATNTLMLVLALVLATMVMAGRAGPWEIIVITGAMSLVFGLQHPSWRGLPADLVPAEAMTSASHLTVTKFQVARALGPLVAGLLISGPGVVWAFWVNAFSFAGAIGALLLITQTRRRSMSTEYPASAPAVLGSFKSALRVRGVWLGVALTGSIAFLGLPLVQLSTLLAVQTYRIGPEAYGILVSAFGWGSLLAAVAVSAFHHRLAGRWVVLYGFVVLSIALLVAGMVPLYAVGVAAMACAGISFAIITTSCHAAVQLLAPAESRGRAAALYAIALFGGSGIGVLMQAWLAGVFSVSAVLVAAGAVALAIAAMLGVRLHWFKSLDV